MIKVYLIVGLGRATFFLARVRFKLAVFVPVRVGLFRPRASSGRPFLDLGQFGPPIFAYFCPFCPNFQLKMQYFWFGLGWATQNLVQPGSGHPKSGPGWVGSLKIHGLRAEFRVRLWPDTALLNCGF